MVEVHDRLFVGCDYECFENRDGWVTVHACKSPCHQKAVGYRGSLHRTHPHYLVLERGSNLYLNMIDPPTPLFMMPLFTEFLRFANRHWTTGKRVFIHCNKGESRAPSLALLYLAQDVGAISGQSYDEAKGEFLTLYPPYMPGRGIQIYMRQNWEQF